MSKNAYKKDNRGCSFNDKLALVLRNHLLMMVANGKGHVQCGAHAFFPWMHKI